MCVPKNVLVFILLVKISQVYSGGSGPVGDIKIYELGECDPVLNLYGVRFELVTHSDDSKGITADGAWPFDIDDSIELLIDADRWSDNNDWEKDAFSHEGKFLDLLNKFIPTIWKNIRDKSDPKVEDDSLVPAGQHSIDDFKDLASNVDLPQILYGRFKVRFHLVKDDEEFVCLMAEGEAFEPGGPGM